uniref:CSON007862 protein n=1 Tax=Culicoides sonorensis TaxID=179676 RepID=A0A336KDG3_CULSO
MGQKLSVCFGRTLIINDVKNCSNPDCDPSVKQTTNTELEGLVNRLERLVERLERTVSARELEYTTQLLQTVQTVAAVTRSKEPPTNHHGHILQRGATIEEDTLKSLSNTNSISCELIDSTPQKLEQRVASLEETANQINCTDDDLLCQIPTVVEAINSCNSNKSDNMSVLAYQDIVAGPLAQFLGLSSKIGGDVATQADFVKKAFDAQLQFLTLATECAKPSDTELPKLLQPTSEQINNIQTFREKHRTSPFFNHLSAISESIPALGWVCVSPTPGPHVKEMNDAGQFYTNRVLKEWKEKDQKHVDWCRSWIQTLTELQAFIKQYHTTGLVWSGKGKAGSGGPPPPPSAMGMAPPPPPPIAGLGDMSLASNGAADERNALFAQINQGEAITSHLKKVTSDMQTHKNPNLRSGPAPYKAPQPFKATGPKPYVAPQQDEKPPVFNRDGKKWLIEYHKNNPNLLVENAEMNNVVYMFKCVNSTLTIKGKINSVVMDSCKKCSVVFDSLVSSVEFVNCQSVQMQVLGKVPTISIDKTDGCQMYLCKDSLDVEIVSSKSSEMNVMIPQANGDYTEQPIPEQFKTTVKGTTLSTTFVESLG